MGVLREASVKELESLRDFCQYIPDMAEFRLTVKLVLACRYNPLKCLLARFL